MRMNNSLEILCPYNFNGTKIKRVKAPEVFPPSVETVGAVVSELGILAGSQNPESAQQHLGAREAFLFLLW